MVDFYVDGGDDDDGDDDYAVDGSGGVVVGWCTLGVRMFGRVSIISIISASMGAKVFMAMKDNSVIGAKSLKFYFLGEW